MSFDGIGTDDWLLASTDKMADSDLVNEIAAWERRYLDERRSGGVVQVRWKRVGSEGILRSTSATKEQIGTCMTGVYTRQTWWQINTTLRGGVTAGV